MDLKKLLDKNYDHALNLRKFFHENPELSSKEFDTTKKIREELEAVGIEVLDLGLKTGVVGKLVCGDGKKVLAIREDIDALPIVEDTELDFKSKNEGVSHSCGHDIHTAVLIYVARILAELKDKFNGTILFIFQPAEEVALGAKEILSTGIFDKYEVDTLLGLHCSPEIDVGKLGLIRGPANASTDIVAIDVKGQGGHGAHPYRAIDPIVTSAYLIAQLQTVMSRENLPTAPGVLTIGSIHGGSAPNVIPDVVKLEGTLRSLDHEYRDKDKEAIVRICKLCTQSFRADCDVRFYHSLPPLINSVETIDLLEESIIELFGEEAIHNIKAPSMGSDDFAVLLENCKYGAQFRLGTGIDEDKNTRYGLHNAKNVFKSESIYYGAGAICQFVLNFFKGG